MEPYLKRNMTAIRQVLSALAVVLSLIFVGLQIKQNTEAERATTRQALADGSRDVVLALATNPSLAEAFYQLFPIPNSKGPHYRQMTPTDSAVAETFAYALVRNAENVFLQYHEGVIDQSVLKTYYFESPRWRTPQFARYWASYRSLFDPTFVSAFEGANGIR